MHIGRGKGDYYALIFEGLENPISGMPGDVVELRLSDEEYKALARGKRVCGTVMGRDGKKGSERELRDAWEIPIPVCFELSKEVAYFP